MGLPTYPFGDAVSLVPLFCFDPREPECFQDSTQFDQYNKKLLESVSNLRTDLQSRGSNLLVVNGQYDKMIPSIARVLGASEVVTFRANESSIGISNQLNSFKSQAINEVAFNLGMHSISFRVVDPPSESITGSLLFPPFPRINPGRIPSAA
jgi:deoxyribodipyrimidine photolyase